MAHHSAPVPGADRVRVEHSELLARPYAHRGLHGPGGPVENSLSAVEAAVRAGLGVEVDVRLSSDGVAVVHHDASLRRLSGDPRRVRRLSAQTLGRLRLRDSDDVVPRLEEVLDLVTGRVPVLLDVKVGLRAAERCRIVGEVARLTAGSDAPLAVVSFDPWLLASVARHCPSIWRGQSAGVALTPSLRSLRTMTHPVDGLWFNGLSRPQFVTYNVARLPHRSAARVRDDLPVIGWTVRCAHVLSRVLTEVDGVIAEGAGIPALTAGAVAAGPCSVACT